MTTLGDTLRPLRAAIEASGAPLLTPEQRDAERGGYTDTLNRLHTAEARVSVLEVELAAATQRAEAAEAKLTEVLRMLWEVESRAFAAESKLAVVPWDAIAAVCDALTHLPPVPDGYEYPFPLALIRSINMVLAWLQDRPQEAPHV